MREIYNNHRQQIEESTRQDEDYYERPFLQLPVPEYPPEFQEAHPDEEDEKEPRRVIIIDI